MGMGWVVCIQAVVKSRKRWLNASASLLRNATISRQASDLTVSIELFHDYGCRYQSRVTLSLSLLALLATFKSLRLLKKVQQLLGTCIPERFSQASTQHL